VGKHWTKKLLRGLQCILLATHGVVGPNKDFFEKAFGADFDEFRWILLLPEDYIIHRRFHEKHRHVERLEKLEAALSRPQKVKLGNLLASNDFTSDTAHAGDKAIAGIIRLYVRDRQSRVKKQLDLFEE
jgi:hypothetical protein